MYTKRNLFDLAVEVTKSAASGGTQYALKDVFAGVFEKFLETAQKNNILVAD